jgi:hypothetical protein
VTAFAKDHVTYLDWFCFSRASDFRVFARATSKEEGGMGKVCSGSFHGGVS